MTTYDTLSNSYDAGRLGYANDIYTTLVEFGLKPASKVLDVACGTGLAGGPLIENNYDVTGVDISEPMLELARKRHPDARFVQGSAEKLPFDDATFDVAISAQALHQVDRTAAMREMLRVLRPGGTVAVWWKHLLGDDPVKRLRDVVAREVGAEQPPSGLNGSFKAFYAASLHSHALRVIPWCTALPLSKYMQYERSRKSVADAMQELAEAYFTELEARLREQLGAGDPVVTLNYTHYLYIGKK